MYVPITTPQHFADRVRLGAPSPGVEDLHLEFKAKCHYDHPDTNKRLEEQREVARDITQFSNAEGGTVLYGVNEKKDRQTGIVTAHGLVRIDDINNAVDWIVKAIGRFLYPATPQPKVTAIDVGGQHVIAVNVDPAIELQGVWDRLKPEDGMEFLYRNNNKKEQMTMDQVAIKMAGTPNRAKRLRLRGLLARSISTKVVRVLCPLYNGAKGNFEVILKEPEARNGVWAAECSEEDQFTLLFTFNAGAGGTKVEERVDVPYEYLAAAWWDERNSIAVVQLTAMITPGSIKPAWR